MKYVYTLKDTKVGNYLPPFLASNHEQAKNMVANIVLSGDTKIQLATNPEDFLLVCIEAWDEDAGAFSPADRVVVGNAMEISLDVLRRQTAMREKIEHAKSQVQKKDE